MAATDSTYRNTKTLHIVFAVSSILTLLVTIAMFSDDYFREWKVEQRLFRTVEEEMAIRNLLSKTPSKEKQNEIMQIEEELKALNSVSAQAKARIEASMGDLLSVKLKKENEKADVKAKYDSVMSFYNKAVDQFGPQSNQAVNYKSELQQIKQSLDKVSDEVDANQQRYDSEFAKPLTDSELAALPAGTQTILRQRAQSEGNAQPSFTDLKDYLDETQKRNKELTAEFDRFVKLASQKRWTGADTFRTLPVIDAFASPVKIQQTVLDELPIDYNFKYVTRYDRCTTCHLGITQSGFGKAALRKLNDDPGQDRELTDQFLVASKILKDRKKLGGMTDLPDPERLRPTRISADQLTAGRVTEFCNHPRLDLFVDENSPHPSEKFGCTICHAGQGSATAFFEASHSPNNSTSMERWEEVYGWKSNHFWDYPMLSHRFVESSCLKCHHQVTDLVREGVRQEAPKLLKGYNLVRELGCFGCHEISGLKSGRRIGPDMRLEPDPPLEMLSPAERVKAQSDPLNPPGTMRKVGPSLFRLAEKTTESWVRPWIKAPRDFRPDTKMPHFYMQVNNLPENLPDSQKKFPDTEIASIAHYLIAKSQANVNELKKWHSEPVDAGNKDLQQLANLNASLTKCEQRLAELQAKKAKIESEMKELAALPGDVDNVRKQIAAPQLNINHRKEMLAQAPPVAMSQLPAKAPDEKRGRMLFGERGCMACHVHQGTERPGQAVDGKKVPELIGEATFGPNLSRVAAKLMPEGRAAEDARKWLVQWLLNPSHHNPRTLMPNVQLQPEDANDIAAWLLAQKATDWTPVAVAEPETETLLQMAKMHLEKLVPRSRAEQILKSGLSDKDAQEMKLGAEADERELQVDEKDLGKPLSSDKLMMYVGKKGIGYQGCFGCHSIPGFQTAKQIGTALNDWGKKDAERLAFEDSDNFVKSHFNIVKDRDDAKDPSQPAKDWHKSADGKRPYEKFFADMLDHHHQRREGFLHLKLMEPRSYDFNRIKSWDERLRMPQFSFARSRPKAGESAEEFERRASYEEAEVREAVMTFVLGLVAEPVPSKYVYNPAPDRLNEVKGQQVIDKFNCAGCHVIRPGAVDFKPFDFKSLNDNPEVFKSPADYKGDDVGDSRMGLIRNHLSWAGLPQPKPDRQTVHGVPPVIDYKQLEDDPDSADKTKTQVWLMDAFQFGSNGNARDLQASGVISIPNENVLHNSPELGGAFMTLLSKYLRSEDPAVYGTGKVNYSVGAGPPTLIHEGERVQPDWLYRFLLNPMKIRELTVLRMPKFNMSEDDAQALVNYFTSVDKVHNFGIGLTYPYVGIPQREPTYLRQRTAEYIARLKATPVPKDVKETGNVNLNPDGKFKNAYEQRLASLQKYFDAQFQKELDAIKEKKKQADDQLQKAEKEKNQAESDLAKKAKEDAEKEEKEWNANGQAKLKDKWEHEEAYVADAHRLVVNGNLCLTCHKVGGVEPKEYKGPTLDGFFDRGRPDWTQRWVTNPKRFLHYE